MRVTHKMVHPVDVVHELVTRGFQPQAVLDLMNSREGVIPGPYTGGKLGMVVHVEHKGARLYCNAVMSAESVTSELIEGLLELRFHPQAVVSLLNSRVTEFPPPFSWEARGFMVSIYHKGVELFSAATALFGR